MKNRFLKFPDNFFWGAGTSAHQVEGNNVNDWSEWEKINYKRLASEAKARCISKTRFASPDYLCQKFGHFAQDPENYISGLACGHYNQYPNDFELAQNLNHNAHRFSIEWSRIEPAEGKFRPDEIKHYRDVVLSLRERGIEPFVTLWHFTNPIWFRDKGAWKSHTSIKYFSRYVKEMVENLKDIVNYWITVNEPMVYAASSYIFGRFPAGKKNPFSFLQAVGNLIKAHKSAYEIIKSTRPETQVGIATSIIYFDAYKNKLVNRLQKEFADRIWNDYFLNRIKCHQDFIGVNHYFHNLINSGFSKNENKNLSDMGWELYPEAIYYSLKELQKYSKPIYITENGLADAEDKRRTWFIKEILKNVHRAIEEGVDVKGYFYWSLMDNFEWHKGFWPRFGLIEVDYENLERKVRKSAIEYSKIIKDNGIAADKR